MFHAVRWVLLDENQTRLQALENRSVLPFRFSAFKDLWHIQDSHGHTGKTIQKQLEQVIGKLKKKGARDVLDRSMSEEDKELSSFMFVLQDLLKIAKEKPEYRLYSDKCWDATPYKAEEIEEGYKSEGIRDYESTEEENSSDDDDDV